MTEIEQVQQALNLMLMGIALAPAVIFGSWMAAASDRHTTEGSFKELNAKLGLPGTVALVLSNALWITMAWPWSNYAPAAAHLLQSAFGFLAIAVLVSLVVRAFKRLARPYQQR